MQHDMMAARSQAPDVDEVIVIDDKDDSDIQVLIDEKEDDGTVTTGSEAKAEDEGDDDSTEVRNSTNKLEVNKMLP